jgi:putative endonuclease
LCWCRPAIARGLVDAIGAQQGLGVAGVFAGHGVHQLQHVQRTQADVGQVADGGGHHVQGTLRIMLRAAAASRAAAGQCKERSMGSSSSEDRHGCQPPPRSRRGDAAEDRALAHLQAAGLRLVTRNYRTPGRGGGEIDLVMREPDGTLVFVEVRQRAAARAWRRGGQHRRRIKRRRIMLAARHYLMRLASAAALPL